MSECGVKNSPPSYNHTFFPEPFYKYVPLPCYEYGTLPLLVSFQCLDCNLRCSRPFHAVIWAVLHQSTVLHGSIARFVHPRPFHLT